MVRKPSYLAALICLLLVSALFVSLASSAAGLQAVSEIAGNRYIVNPDVRLRSAKTIMY